MLANVLKSPFAFQLIQAGRLDQAEVMLSILSCMQGVQSSTVWPWLSLSLCVLCGADQLMGVSQWDRWPSTARVPWPGAVGIVKSPSRHETCWSNPFAGGATDVNIVNDADEQRSKEFTWAHNDNIYIYIYKYDQVFFCMCVAFQTDNDILEWSKKETVYIYISKRCQNLRKYILLDSGPDVSL